MNESLNWELLAKYLSDECTPLEKSEIETWMYADPKNQQLLEVLEISWNTSEPDLQTSDTESLWQKLAVRADFDSGVEEEINQPPQKPAIHAKQKPYLFQLAQYPIWRYAAVLIIFLLSALYIFSDDLTSLFKFESQTEFISLSVPNSQHESVTLSDGSVITLDAGTKFSYPEKFNEDKREVFLSGEAFFEVASIPGKPFTVYVNQAAIQVVGTKFNIRAWQQERKLTVTVSEGKVLLHPYTEESESSIALNPGYASTLPLNGHPSQPQLVDVSQSIGWMKKEIYFENTPLSEILSQLERWYNVDFETRDLTAINDRLTVYLKNRPLEEHLKLIGELADVRFARNGKVYRLIPR